VSGGRREQGWYFFFSKREQGWYVVMMPFQIDEKHQAAVGRTRTEHGRNSNLKIRSSSVKSYVSTDFPV
jgi:hypothetical protein